MKIFVLIIDDDPIFSRIQKMMVSMAGLSANPHLFSNGQQALDFIEQQNGKNSRFLLFLDINMPVMNAWELLDVFRQRRYIGGIRVAIVTSSVNEADRVKAEKYPQVVAYLTKPIRTEELGKLRDTGPIADFLI